MCVGFISSWGIQEDPTSSSLEQLQRVLIALVKESAAKKVSFLIQLAAVDSLLEMCPINNRSYIQVIDVVKEWLRTQMSHPHGHVLGREFDHRLRYPATS